jgi:murein DD-endopeptidase MepM/ murein hydrolase activator NlpD
MRKVVVLLLVVALGVAGAYVAAGMQAPPSVSITRPGKFAGAAIPLALNVTTPDGVPADVAVTFEQNGAVTAVPGVPATISAQTVPGLKVAAGPAKITVTASRRVWRLRTLTATASADVTIKLEKPRVAVLSTKHYINLGGSEFIVYRATPAGVESGVKVGDLEYKGFPLKADGDIYGAFFALRYDQDVNTPMTLFARDETGETATSGFDRLTFPKQFKKSTIPLDDSFLNRVVPAILAGTQEVAPQGALSEQFVVINSELRKKNNATIASLSAKTAPSMLWGGEVFHSFRNNAAEAAFADFRTYVYQGKDVDKQVHLGFDLASFANTPILAANKGTVVFAAELGIYGNCVILDHGMGVQSLYGHLSSIAVKVGDTVTKEQELGKSGMTGLAGGDHLHFTMLVNGQMVNPIEWWDAHWIQDRILRKLKDAGF